MPIRKSSLAPNFTTEMDKINRRARKSVADEILVGTKIVETSAKRRVQGGSKTGITYEKYQPRRSHQASAAGESPASDLGTLAQSINGFMDPSGLTGGVEVIVPYAEVLELGGRNMEARPFLQPALEENKRTILKRIALAISKAIKF